MGEERQYWLVKTEPGEWSWADQAANGGVSVWDGVRNAQAQKHMKAMREGDLCFFYHSGTTAREIVGVDRVAKEWYSLGQGKDGAVDLVAIGEMLTPVTLKKVKEEEKEDEKGSFEGFMLLKQPRLSVMPVSLKAWNRICDLGGFHHQ